MGDERDLFDGLPVTDGSLGDEGNNVIASFQLDTADKEEVKYTLHDILDRTVHRTALPNQ